MNAGLVCLSGLVIGAFCYLIAEWLTPRRVTNPGDHDLFLAIRLGFIYTSVVGLWLGWLQRSWQRALTGAVVGIVIGAVYMWLCASRNFLAIMVGFPVSSEAHSLPQLPPIGVLGCPALWRVLARG
jgi:hypothetical protein